MCSCECVCVCLYACSCVRVCLCVCMCVCRAMVVYTIVFDWPFSIQICNVSIFNDLMTPFALEAVTVQVR